MTNQPDRPSTLSRLWALLIGPLYLLGLIGFGQAATRAPAWLSALSVLGGALAIMAVLVVFGLKADRCGRSERRFGLSTLFLVMLPLSIYLTAVRRVLGEKWVGNPQSPIVWLGVAVFSVAFMLVTTVILLWLAESLMWLAVLLLRRSNIVARSVSEASNIAARRVSEASNIAARRVSEASNIAARRVSEGSAAASSLAYASGFHERPKWHCRGSMRAPYTRHVDNRSQFYPAENDRARVAVRSGFAAFWTVAGEVA